VVPAECRLQVDFRAATADAFDLAYAEVEALSATTGVDGVTCELHRLATHRPMEKGPATARLAELAIAIASEIGFDLRDTATGGASDANTTAGMGIPTLDGLGPIGGDDHSADEWLDLSSVAPRMTLLAQLIARVGEAL
jgi:glutamate carboxypeptidase